MTDQDLIRSALDVWGPTWPRRVTLHQEWADGPEKAAELLASASDDGFISTYAFPRGHPKGGNIPEVDTLFIDFDMESGEYDPDNADRQEWERDISALLVRARRLARFLVEEDATGWRAALSGHKGVHLFLDFPTIPVSAGDYSSFVAGINEYATEITGHLIAETKISDLGRYVDVTSSDLARLHRAPNTLHPKATKALGEKRYCVPITLERLAEIDVDDYARLTNSPRTVPYDSREPNEKAGEIIEQYIRTANPDSFDRHSRGPSMKSQQRYNEYVEEIQNDNIDLEDVKFLTRDRPCVWRFHEREDKFNYGNQSHFAEIWAIRELQEKNVPVNVMHEFLANSPDYSEEQTDFIIRQILSRDYSRFTLESLLRKAPEFANPEECAACNAAREKISDQETQLNHV